MKRMGLPLLFLLVFSGDFLSAAAEEGLMADLVLVNGRIFTVNAAQPWAQAVAIRGSRFVLVGSDEQARKLVGSGTQVIDLQGRLALPGFNDAHVHFANGGLYLLGIDLRPAGDEKEFVRILKDYIGKTPKGEWITGGNWDHENWPSKRHPHRELIDRFSADHPVLVSRLDGHMALANSLALKLAGITRDTPDPQGGEIVRDRETGEPSGILRDTAMALVDKVIPPLSREKRERAIRAAMRHAQELGVTSIQDNSSAEDLAIYQELYRKGELGVRVSAWRSIDFSGDFERIGITAPHGDSFLRLGTVKVFVDGSMGAGTALFFAPYADDPATAGLPIHKKERLEELIVAADKAGLQVAAHAIGDRANAWILDAFASACAANGRRGARHRVEHAQVVRADDVRRFAELGVIASVQPSHCIDDIRWAAKRNGARTADAYRWRSFLDAGVRLAFGTDWDVEPLDPRLGLYAAVTRELPGGGPQGGWHPAEKLSLEQAITAYTLGSAYAEFQESDKGSVEAGKLADLVVMAENLFQVAKKEILVTPVAMTILDGKVVFRR